MNLEICKKCMLEHNKEESIVIWDMDKEEPTVLCRCGRMVFKPLVTDCYAFNGKNWNIYKSLSLTGFIEYFNRHKRLKLFFDKIKDLIKDIIIKHKLNKFIKNNTIIPDSCFYKLEHELSEWNKN